jgi:hypothetical protein
MDHAKAASGLEAGTISELRCLHDQLTSESQYQADGLHSRMVRCIFSARPQPILERREQKGD